MVAHTTPSTRPANSRARGLGAARQSRFALALRIAQCLYRREHAWVPVGQTVIDDNTVLPVISVGGAAAVGGLAPKQFPDPSRR